VIDETSTAVTEQAVREPPQYTPAPCNLLPWKWCPSHVWCGLPLCQF